MVDERVRVIFEGQDNLSGMFRSLRMGALALGVAITAATVALGVLLARQIGESIRQTVDYTLAINDLAQAFSITSEEASILYNLADDNRIEANGLTMALRTMARRGIAPTVEGLQLLARRYALLTDPTERATFLMENFGRSGTDMARIMDLGEEGLAAYVRGLDRGLIVTDENRAAVLRYYGALDNLHDSFLGVRMVIANAFMPALSTVMEGFTRIIQENAPALEEFFSNLGTWLERNAGRFVVIVRAMLGGDWETVRAQILKSLGPEMRTTVENFLNTLERFGDWARSERGQLVLGFLKGLGVGLLIVAGLIGAAFVISSIAVALGALAVPVFILALPLAALLGLIIALAFNIGGFRDAFITNLQHLPDDLRTIFEGIYRMFREWMVEIAEAIVATDWFQVGWGIIQGIISGVQAHAQDLIDVVVAAASGAWWAAKTVLGIHSPSTLFSEIGRNMMLGMAQGISGSSGLPQAAMAGSIPGVGYSAGAGGGGSGEDMRAIRDDIHWLVRSLPTALRDVMAKRR